MAQLILHRDATISAPSSSASDKWILFPIILLAVTALAALSACLHLSRKRRSLEKRLRLREAAYRVLKRSLGDMKEVNVALERADAENRATLAELSNSTIFINHGRVDSRILRQHAAQMSRQLSRASTGPGHIDWDGGRRFVRLADRERPEEWPIEVADHVAKAGPVVESRSDSSSALSARSAGQVECNGRTWAPDPMSPASSGGDCEICGDDNIDLEHDTVTLGVASQVELIPLTNLRYSIAQREGAEVSGNPDSCLRCHVIVGDSESCGQESRKAVEPPTLLVPDARLSIDTDLGAEDSEENMRSDDGSATGAVAVEEEMTLMAESPAPTRKLC